MSDSNDGPRAFLTLVDVAKWYVGGWIVASALDEALSKRHREESEPTVILVPPPVPPEPQDQAVLEVLSQVEGQLDELQAKIDALPTRPEPEPARLAKPQRKLSVPTPRRGSLQELNAALAAYNVAARRLGMVVIAPGLDDAVEHGDPEKADDAISGVIFAAQELMLLGAALVKKAEAMAQERSDLTALTASSRVTEEKLPALLYLAEAIDEELD